MHKGKIASQLILIALLSSCGGNDNGDEDQDHTNVDTTVYRGVFLDSAVQGLDYETATQSGTTDENGEFDYLSGESIEFFVGDISIGTADAVSLVTPSDLSTTNSNWSRYHKRNVIQFLQTIDNDGSPDNGIVIRDDISDFTNGHEIDFDLLSSKFEENESVLTIIRNATNVSELISLEDAITHYASTLASEGITYGPEQTKYIEITFNVDPAETPPAIIGSNYTTAGDAIGRVQVGAGNGYVAEVATITLAYATTKTITTAVNSSIAEIASQFSAIEGITTNASSTVVISSINDNGGLSIKLNGVAIVDSSDYSSAITAQDIAIAINNLTNTTLPGITAANDDIAGTVTITSNSGVDLAFSVANSTDANDGITVSGATPRIVQLQGDGLGDVDVNGDGLIDAITEDNDGGGFSASTGGTIQFTFSEDIVMDTQQLIGGLDDGSGLFQTSIPQAAFINNPFDPTDTSSYNHSTSLTIYDSIGNAHTMALYFVKEHTTRSWTLHVQIDGKDLGDPNTAQPPPLDTASTPASFPLLFNDDGTFNATASQTVEIRYWNPVDTDGEGNGARQGLTSADRIALEASGITINPENYSNIIINVNGAHMFAGDFEVISVYEDSLLTD